MWLCLELHVFFICRKFYKKGNVDVSQQITAQKACFFSHCISCVAEPNRDLIIDSLLRRFIDFVVELKPLRFV